MHFEAVRAPLGPERTISTRLGASRYRMVSEPIPDPNVRVCLAPQSCRIQRERYVFIGVSVASHIE